MGLYGPFKGANTRPIIMRQARSPTDVVWADLGRPVGYKILLGDEREGESGVAF